MKKLEKYKKIDLILHSISIIYFVIPICLFFIFWFKFYISIPAIIVTLYLSFVFIKKIKFKKEKEYSNIFNLKKWGIILFLLLILNIFSGSGGLSYQNGDYNARNAVLHDLIKYDWPVKYDYSDNEIMSNLVGENGYLSYYFTYFLPSGAVGKVLGFKAASISLFIMQYVGLILIFYFLARLFNKVRISYFLIFVAFSGLDIIGYTKVFTAKPLLDTHIDTWAGYFCYSSNITQLFWVFNQFLPSSIITLLFLNQYSLENVGILMLFLLSCSPFPAVGFFLLVIVMTMFGLFSFNDKSNKSNLKANLKELFNKNNFLSLIPIFSVCLFLMINPSSQFTGFIFEKFPFDQYGSLIIKRYILFWFLEFGICSVICITNKNYKHILSIIVILSLLPIYYIGNGCDFVNRVSLPKLLYLMCFLIYRFNNKNNKITFIIIIIYLLISSVTGFNEMYRSIKMTKYNGFNSPANFNDNWKTYSDIKSEEAIIYIKNFSSNYDNQKFIYKYILR